jgi:hypothetical protein
MKVFTLIKGFMPLCTLMMLASKLSAQTATITPANTTIAANTTQDFTVVTTGLGANNDNRTFFYTISGPGVTIPASPVNFNCTSGCNSETHSFQFPTAGTYTVSVTVTQTQNGSASASTSTTITVINPNLWSTSSNGTVVSGFVVNNGVYSTGPLPIFTPNTGSGSSTAALALSAPQPGVNPGDPATPYFYWLPNTSGNSGVVEVWGATANGSNQTLIGTLDVNGAGTNSLGFVRLGMGPNGVCYLLAGDGTTIYLASFKPNGVTVNSSLPLADRLKIDDTDGVTINGGGANEFQNGDLAVLIDPQQGGVNIYALANVTGGTTKIFIGKPNGNSTTFTKRWDLVDPANQPFTGSVNGVAFDFAGSMYLSTAAGVYFVDKTTVNQAGIGTVVTSLAWSGSGLQDLASNSFPAGSTLPVKLKSFSGSLSNNSVTLKWETESEINFDYFQVERSTNGSSFTAIGSKDAAASASLSSAYDYADDLRNESSNVFYYRLKIIDKDGRFEYSNVIMLRKDKKALKNLFLTPNPVRGTAANARIETVTSGVITLRIADMNGRILHQQTNNVSAGVNSISITGISKLQPGMYMLQMVSNGETVSTKFSKL